MDFWHVSLTAISTILFVAAIFFSIKLSRETKGERYWVFFAVATLSMAVFHFVRHELAFGFLSPGAIDLILEIAEIIGAFSLAYACFGLYRAMRRIRKKLSGEL